MAQAVAPMAQAQALVARPCDLAGGPLAAIQAQVQMAVALMVQAQALVARPFDLACGPLAHNPLLRLASIVGRGHYVGDQRVGVVYGSLPAHNDRVSVWQHLVLPMPCVCNMTRL